MGMVVPITLYLERQAVGWIWAPDGSLVSSVLGLSGEHQWKAVRKEPQQGPQRFKGPEGGWQSIFSSSLSLHGQGAEGNFLVGLLGKTVGMLPNAEEGVDEPRSPGLRIARAQNQLWSWGVCAYNGSH